MRYQVVRTSGHKGKSLEMDPEHEAITIRSIRGEKLGTISWKTLLDQAGMAPEPERTPETREQPRISLVLRVRYSTPTGKSMEGRAGGIGGGGLFIESSTPLPVGTDLLLELALPNRAGEWMQAKATVAWVCPKSDQYTFSPGMGVRFVEISAESRARILEFVNSHRQMGR